MIKKRKGAVKKAKPLTKKKTHGAVKKAAHKTKAARKGKKK